MLQKGIKNQIERMVTETITAEHIGSGELSVLATPAMIALIEETSWRSVAAGLAEGQGTVGTKIDVAHIAATPCGMKVRCETELVEVDGRRLVFSATVFDETGKIGEGRHERFIVDNAKFQAKADAKKHA